MLSKVSVLHKEKVSKFMFDKAIEEVLLLGIREAYAMGGLPTRRIENV